VLVISDLFELFALIAIGIYSIFPKANIRRGCKYIYL